MEEALFKVKIIRFLSSLLDTYMNSTYRCDHAYAKHKTLDYTYLHGLLYSSAKPATAAASTTAATTTSTSTKIAYNDTW
jgi:hypothetical protein